jgi:hypothetical protein
MTKKQTIMLAMAGAAILAGAKAQAQFSYSSGDLLLDFRPTSTSSPNPDLTIDLGNVSTFVAGPLTSGYFAESLLTGTFGGAANVNFSALASGSASPSNIGPYAHNSVIATVAATSSQPSTPSAATATNPRNHSLSGTANVIDSIGSGPTSPANVISSTANTATVAQSTQVSYTSEVLDSTGNADLGAGGTATLPFNPENTQTGSGSIFSDLFAINNKSSGAATYLGFFTFQSSGEVDFTTPGGVTTDLDPTAVVPEPSTYGMIAGFGVLALALRRQIRSLAA